MGSKKQARIGDYVLISCPHGPQIGVITTGSPYSFADSRRIARLTDVVVCLACGETGNVNVGAPFSFADSLPKARVGDKTVGTCDIGCDECPHGRTGVIITGSDYMYTD